MDMMSQNVDKIFAALCSAQKEMKVAPKENFNPFHKSKYADLQTVWETIKEPLCNHDLCVTQMLNESGDNSQLITILAHSSGQWVKSVATLKLKVTRINKEGLMYDISLTPQEVCAAVTYFRRMALSAITGCYAGEKDNDGEDLDKPEESISRPQPPKKAPEDVKEASAMTITKEQFAKIWAQLANNKHLIDKVRAFAGCNDLKAIPYAKYTAVCTFIHNELQEATA